MRVRPLLERLQDFLVHCQSLAAGLGKPFKQRDIPLPPAPALLFETNSKPGPRPPTMYKGR